ncbi:MAG: hypothetical protein WA776_22520 [Xanthobacteraceae bacterium]
MVAGERALYGIHGDPSHFAIVRKNCQHVDEPIMAVAQPSPHHRTRHAVPCHMHGGREPNEGSAFGLCPAFFLIEACVLGLGVNRMDGVNMHWVRSISASRMRGVLGADRDARKDEHEKSGKDNSLRSHHAKRSTRLAVNPA